MPHDDPSDLVRRLEAAESENRELKKERDERAAGVVDSAEFVRRYNEARAQGCPQVCPPEVLANLYAGRSWDA